MRVLAVIVLVAAAIGAWAVTGRRAPAAAPAPDAELLALHARGMRGYEQRTTEGAIDALQSFRAAIARDSTFAPAWAGLAQTLVRVDERRFTIPGIGGDSVLRLAVAAADRALALDSTMAHVWTARAIVTRKLDPTDVRPSMQAARRAIAMDSADAKAWHVLAIGLAEQGDLEAAIATWREEVRRSPLYKEGLVFLAIGHFWHRQYDSAAVWVDSALAVDPMFYTAWQVAGDVARERGDYERALAAHETARRLTTDVEVVNTLAGKATAEAMSGRVAEARRTLRMADSLAQAFQPPPTHNAVWIAGAWSALGDTARALEWLSRHAQSRDLHFQIHVRCDPRLAALAGNPRYEALLRPMPGTRC